MVTVLMFEANVIKMGSRYYIYPPKQYQERVAKLHGKKVKILLVYEEESPCKAYTVICLYIEPAAALIMSH